MKSILFIKAASRHAGGIQGQILRLAQTFAQRGLFTPVLATSAGPNALADQFRRNDFPVYEIPLLRHTDIFAATRALNDIVQRHDIALMQSHMFRESLAARCLRRRRPDIPHVYRAHVSTAALPISCWRRRLHHTLECLTSRYVDRYAANGRFITDELTATVPTHKVRTIINGRAALGAPQLLTTDPQTPLPSRIALIANLTPGKGHDTLLNAVHLLKQQGITVNARFIGGPLNTCPDHTDILRQQARHLDLTDQIEFFGYADDVYTALQDTPIVVLPSDAEGVPNCILEALSIGKLVIASAVGGLPEIITHRTNGLLHPPRDPQALAQLLTEVFSTPAHRWQPLRDAALEIWRDRFQMETMVDAFIELYRELNVLPHTSASTPQEMPVCVSS